MTNEISVYIDIIFMENLLIDYVIIDISGRLTSSSLRPYKILCGAASGAFYAVIVCIVPALQNNIILSIFTKMISSFCMCILSFGLKNIRKLFVCNFILYIVSFLFAGLFYALKLTGCPVDMNQGGAVVRWGDSSVIYIIETIFLGYIAVTLFFYYISKYRNRSARIMNLKIYLNGRGILISALCDTGNELHDSLYNLPVVICEIDIFKELFDIETRDVFSGKFMAADTVDINESIKFFSDIGLVGRISVVPFKTLNCENNVMVGLVADKILFDDIPEKETKGTVCFVNRKLSADGDYNGIVSPELF